MAHLKLFTAGLRVAKHRLHHRRCGKIDIKRFEIYEVERMKGEKKTIRKLARMTSDVLGRDIVRDRNLI